MSKFVMECPRCNNYVEGSTGLFAKKKINCSCGYVIDVKANRLSSKICPKCGNTVVYDQIKGDKAICPVCHEKVNKREDLQNAVEITCPSCSLRLTVNKKDEICNCPLCDTEINIQERITKEQIKKEGAASVIKYEGGNDVFVWKHPIEDFNLGSQLIVHESQEALFFRDGKALDLFRAGRYTLAEKDLPMLKDLYKHKNSDDEVLHSEIYFINLATQMGIKWGTDSKVRCFDPASGLHVELGACGTFNICVSDSRKLIIKLVGTSNELIGAEVMGLDSFGIELIVGKFRSLIINKVKSNLARAIRENNINILSIDEYIDVLSKKLKEIINESLELYGLTMPEFYITNILTPDDDPNYNRLKQQFADKTLLVRQEKIRQAEAEAAQDRKVVEAQTAAKLKMIDAQSDAEIIKMKAQAEAEAYRMQAFAEADEMKAKGYTYEQETTRQVSLEAMQNGLTGDPVSVAVSNGVVGSVVDTTRAGFNPNANKKVEAWNCPVCGTQGITSKFCPECGSKKLEVSLTWNCPVCGTQGITSKFCPECGSKKPEASLTWNCACGAKGITSKFCPECGAKKEQ
jgi:membrane protease subunit (stomatin/prohibitin family)